MALNIREKLQKKKGKKPNKAIQMILSGVIAKPNCKKMKLEIIDNVGTKNLKPPFVVISNHTSRCDWQYVGRAFHPQLLNFVASDTEFYRAHMHLIFDLMCLIPKKNFVPDLRTIRQIINVVNHGGNVVFFPEGKSSISGTNQPIMTGTSKLIKHLGVPVYATRISGGYMSNTQWNIADRPGKVVIEVNQVFTPEETQTMSLEDMDAKMNAAIYNDDFEWNKDGSVRYKGMEHIAEKLEEHLYWCPKCNGECTMHGKDNVFTCEKCGNSVKIDSNYQLIPNSEGAVIPKNLRVWFELQRRREYRAIKSNPDFCIEEKVKFGHLPTDHYVPKTATCEICGSGMVRLTRDEFSYIGTRNGEHFELHNKTVNMASVVLETDSSYFGAFFDGEYFEFHPEHNLTSKWLLSVEEAHRLAGGKWQNKLPAQQWIYEDDKESDKENYYLEGCYPV